MYWGYGDPLEWENSGSKRSRSRIPDPSRPEYNGFATTEDVALWEDDMGRDPKGYPEDWREIANRIKKAAGWQCVRCGHPHDVATGYVLTVHHLDMQPRNCAWWNLVALCQRCHLKVQSRVRMDRPWPFEHSEWFQPYVAGFYAKKYLRLDLSREETMARLDELLALEVEALKGAR